MTNEDLIERLKGMKAESILKLAESLRKNVKQTRVLYSTISTMKERLDNLEKQNKAIMAKLKEKE